jgi:hypothetical protein
MYKLALFILIIGISLTVNAQKKTSVIEFNKASDSVFMSDSLGTISIQVSCEKGCEIDQLTIKNNPVVSGGNLIYTGFTLGTGSFTSANSSVTPAVSIANNVVSIRNIRYGSATFGIEESWIFTILKNNIRWQIIRSYLNEGSMEKSNLPVWTFNSMQTWDGAILNNGGVAWCRFLGKENFTYGAHTSGMTFWIRIFMDRTAGEQDMLCFRNNGWHC